MIEVAPNLETEVAITLLSDKRPLMDETRHFNSRSPLVTLLIMAIGPLLTNLGLAGADMIDLMLISARFIDDKDSYAVQLVGFSFVMIILTMQVAIFYSQVILVRLSGLIGEGKRSDAAQFLVDCFRIAICGSWIYLSIAPYIVRPILQFAGCTTDLIDRAECLVRIVMAGLPVVMIYHLSCAFIQAIGKSILNGALHVVGIAVQCAVFSPIFLFLFKIDVTECQLASVLAQSIVGLVLFIFIFKGKFSIQPKLSMFFNPISKEVFKALLMASPSLIASATMLLPPTLILRFLTQAAGDEATNYAGVYTIFQKIVLIAGSVPIALAMGLTSAGTHAYGAQDYKRFLKYFGWSVCIALGFQCMIVPFIISKPRLLGKLFFNDETILDLTEKMLPIPFYTFPLQGLTFMCGCILVCMKKPLFSMLPQLIQLVILIAVAKVFSVKYHDCPMKIFYAFNISDGSSFIISILFLIKPLIDVFKKSKDCAGSPEESLVSNVGE